LLSKDQEKKVSSDCVREADRVCQRTKRIRCRSHRGARMWRCGCSVQHAMADCSGGEDRTKQKPTRCCCSRYKSRRRGNI